MTRTTLSLAGLWQAAESFADDTPGEFQRTAGVPGLARFAEPRFTGSSVREIGWLSGSQRTAARRDPQRDYFWFRRSFSISSIPAVARLRFAKAQFGLKVWINGTPCGEHAGCFHSVIFDVTPFLRTGENDILVRLGAHPCVLPPGVPHGSDKERFLWAAGLYDRIDIRLSSTPVIEQVQVTPDIHRSIVRVEWTVFNATLEAVCCSPKLTVRARSEDRDAANLQLQSLTIEPKQRKTFVHELSLPEARLWSPEDPFLYQLNLSTGGDAEQVSFGMREFKFDTVTQRAWLNGRPYYLRGTNIALHRFFEDESCEQLPWTDTWVRRLLGELPKRYHWNCMRWTLGPAPERWLEIADEVGLLIEYEFPIWGFYPTWNLELLKEHVLGWMKDAWNHPSVAWWSLANETHHSPLSEVIAWARKHDSSKRAWNNGYNLPEGEHDPIDDHPYLNHSPLPWATEPWNIVSYEKRAPQKSGCSPYASAHAMVINEYCWFWLKRDGAATPLTEGTYNKFFIGTTSQERIQLYAQVLAGETEYFRAHRTATGVLHFVYLTGEHPWSLTGDLFSNIRQLEIHPEYDVALGNAFHPLGVYLNFWQPFVACGTACRLDAMIINDTDVVQEGEVIFAITDATGKVIEQRQQPFRVSPLCQHTARCEEMPFPQTNGLPYRVYAEARSSHGWVVRSERRFRSGPTTHIT